MAALRLSLGNFKAKEVVAVSIHLDIPQNTKILLAKKNSDGDDKYLISVELLQNWDVILLELMTF